MKGGFGAQGDKAQPLLASTYDRFLQHLIRSSPDIFISYELVSNFSIPTDSPTSLLPPRSHCSLRVDSGIDCDPF